MSRNSRQLHEFMDHIVAVNGVGHDGLMSLTRD